MGTTAQKLAALAEVKADIADAITAKGGTVPTKFADYATAISNLPTGVGKFKEMVNRQVDPTWTLTADDLAECTHIGDSAFYNCYGLVSAVLPSSILTIEYGGFYGCSALASLTLSNSLTSIGRSAFYNCSSLGAITIPISVTSIGSSAFFGCTNAMVTFAGRTSAEVEAMTNYPWGLQTSQIITA